MSIPMKHKTREKNSHSIELLLCITMITCGSVAHITVVIVGVYHGNGIYVKTG